MGKNSTKFIKGLRMARILVIDDKALIRKMLRQALELAGYEVVTARNGHEGLQHYRYMPTELVITDLEMPEQDGLETIRVMRQDFPTVKIIAISGKDWTLSKTKELGVQRTFQKPFGMQELLAAVHELVETRDGRASA
jgi:DNA-binding response OmpR family regulator